MSDQGAGLVDRESTLTVFSRTVENAYTQSTQFYSTERSLIHLPPGTAVINVLKGSEYEVHAVKIEIQAEKTIRLLNLPPLSHRQWLGPCP